MTLILNDFPKKKKKVFPFKETLNLTSLWLFFFLYNFF